MPSTATPQVTRLRAGPIHYTERGPRDATPVVFVHGFLVDGGLWSDVPDRLADAGFRTLTPTWPLGAQPEPMEADADLSPRGVARTVLAFLEALDLHDVVLVGNDTGGAICQLVLDEDPSRIGRLVLTNCDAFDQFPPFPFDQLFRVARHPAALKALLGATRVAALRTGPLGFGLLTRRRLTAAETLPWVTPYLTSAGVRRDLARFARSWSPDEMTEVSPRMARFTRPVLLCWAPEDRFFTLDLGRRLADTFPDARLVEMAGARTFVALDDPEGLAREVAAFAVLSGHGDADVEHGPHQ